MGNIFEKLLSKRIIIFKISSPSSAIQFGFHNKRYTIDAIVETIEGPIESKRKLAQCTLLYLSKAADTFDHNTLFTNVTFTG